MTVPWQGKAIDALLDEGAEGLQYWIEFMPLYEAAFGGDGGHGNVGKLLAMYDEQRGMRVEKLEQAGEALKVALAEVDRQWDAQQGYTRRLPELWQGTAADAALDMLGKQSTLADDDRNHARAAATVIAELAGSLRSSVAAKAYATRELLEGPWGGSKLVRIDGKSPEDVKVIVDVYNAREWIDAGQVRDLARIFPALVMPEDDIEKRTELSGDYGDKVRRATEGWLTETFKPDFDDKLASYVNICAEVDRVVKGQYQNLTDALAQVSDQAYPCPQKATESPSPQPDNQDEPKETSSPGTPGTPGTPSTTTVPASTTPSAVQSPTTSTAQTTATPTTTTPTTTTPTTTIPTTTAIPATITSLDGLAGLSQVANQLSPLTSSLTQAVDQGLSALSGAIQSGVDNAIEKLKESIDQAVDNAGDADGDGDGDGDGDKRGAGEDQDKSSAEFDIGGKHVRFEMGPDGQLKLVLSDATGAQKEFAVGLNEHGMPVVSMSEPNTENTRPLPAEDSPAPGTPEGKTPVPGTPDKDEPVVTAPAPDENTGHPGMPTGIPPTTRREEDGEHRPGPLPQPGESDTGAPFDSGAELAEAGPL